MQGSDKDLSKIAPNSEPKAVSKNKVIRGIIKGSRRQKNNDPNEWSRDDLTPSLKLSTYANGSAETHRCCQNSASSGYSSHSPQIPSCSVNTVTAAYKCLDAIEEGEIIPRPIWPYETDFANKNLANDSSHHRISPLSICTCSYDGSASDYEGTTSLSAREILLELSRTLSVVLEGKCAKTDEEILKEISLTIAQSQEFSRPSLYEEIYQNSSVSSKNSKNSNSSIDGNPTNSRDYRHKRCSCRRKSQYQNLRNSTSSTEQKDKCSSPIYLIPQSNCLASEKQKDSNLSCSCKKYAANFRTADAKNNVGDPSRMSSQSKPEKIVQNYSNPVEHEYTTLECSDESSSVDYSPEVVPKSGWCQTFRGFDKELDFTLDALRAEKLGRVIAQAKRRRQLCRIALVIFGLVFFILSVVIVSLYVTRGRKAFGSMM